MKAVLAALLLGLAAPLLRADEPPELASLKAQYTHADLASDEVARENYILRLARLRFELVMAGTDGWQAVDREIIRHPFRGTLDPIEFIKLRVGQWYSSRHDYLYRPDGTWKMDDPDGALAHGTWSLTRAQYSETFADNEGVSATTFTLILADPQNFIFTDGTHVFFEVRTVTAGLPVR